MDTLNSKQTKFMRTFRVGSFDTDLNGKVKMTSICNFLQEIAGMHADSLNWGINQLLEQDLSWVLTRLKIKVIDYPQWKDEIRIETWPTGIDGLFGNRDFKIYNNAGKVIMLASSSWLIVNIKTKRPIRPHSIISNNDFNNNEKVFTKPLSKLITKIENSHPTHINVQFSDIDINQHVNNVKYVKWMIDSCPFELLQSEFIEELEINFLHEAKYNDSLNVFNQYLANNRHQFEIRNHKNNIEHCRGFLKWK